MSIAADLVEKAIWDLEGEGEKIAMAITQLRATLATIRDGAAPPPAKEPEKNGGGAPPFSKKYDKAAGEAILEIVAESKRPVHLGHIRETLEHREYVFPTRTVSQAVNRLLKAGKLRRVRASPGSGFNFSYTLPLEQAPLDLGR